MAANSASNLPSTFHPAKHLPNEARFWRHVTKTATCWLWNSSPTSNGYGTFRLRTDQGYVSMHPYRVSWLLIGGVVPRGKCLLHTCGTPACVNPNHLRIGTRKDVCAFMKLHGGRVTSGRWARLTPPGPF